MDAATLGFADANVATSWVEDRLMIPQANPSPDGGLTFGDFCLLPGTRELLRAGQPVTLGSRAFDLLEVLVLARGAVVSNRELMDRVWPKLYVEDSNLRFQVGCLRRALGQDRDIIKSIPRRGYLLIDERATALPAPLEEPQEILKAKVASALLALRTLNPHEMQDQPFAGADIQVTCERLQRLLILVVDELWRLTTEAQTGLSAAPSAASLSGAPAEAAARAT